MTDTFVRSEVDLACAVVAAHPERAALGRLAFDVLSTQAEGRSLFTGQRFMEQRARVADVTRERAQTDAGNVLDVLERGPASAAEHALVAAFAVAGFADALRERAETEHAALHARLATHLDFLHLSTPYRLAPLLARLLPPAARDALCDALVEAVLREDEPDVAARARNAARLSVIAALDTHAATAAVARVRGLARDAVTHAASVALGGAAEPPPEVAVVRAAGLAATGSRRPAVVVLRWLSGVALAAWVLRGLALLLRLRREIEVELQATTLQVRSRTTLLGRTVRVAIGAHALGAVAGARREARYALARTVVGIVALCAGVLLGGELVFDAVRGGALDLLVVAALVVGLGSGLDLALEVFVPAGRSRVTMQIDVHGYRPVRLSHVPLADADAFLRALATRLDSVAKTRPAI